LSSNAKKPPRNIFEVAVDPFFSEANMERLRKAIADVEAGRVTEHELIEVYDE
jgi:DNA-damage-inducible protein J